MAADPSSVFLGDTAAAVPGVFEGTHTVTAHQCTDATATHCHHHHHERHNLLYKGFVRHHLLSQAYILPVHIGDISCLHTQFSNYFLVFRC